MARPRTPDSDDLAELSDDLSWEDQMERQAEMEAAKKREDEAKQKAKKQAGEAKQKADDERLLELPDANLDVLERERKRNLLAEREAQRLLDTADDELNTTELQEKRKLEKQLKEDQEDPIEHHRMPEGVVHVPDTEDGWTRHHGSNQHGTNQHGHANHSRNENRGNANRAHSQAGDRKQQQRDMIADLSKVLRYLNAVTAENW
jgi:hypothetical protein